VLRRAGPCDTRFDCLVEFLLPAFADCPLLTAACLPVCQPACNQEYVTPPSLCTSCPPSPLQYYKYTVAADGYLTTQVCSDVFAASFSIYGNDTDADGLPVVDGLLGCGGDFINCSDPALDDPDSQLT
jgi:hypothetical protein